MIHTARDEANRQTLGNRTDVTSQCPLVQSSAAHSELIFSLDFLTPNELSSLVTSLIVDSMNICFSLGLKFSVNLRTSVLMNLPF